MKNFLKEYGLIGLVIAVAVFFAVSDILKSTALTQAVDVSPITVATSTLPTSCDPTTRMYRCDKCEWDEKWRQTCTICYWK